MTSASLLFFGCLKVLPTSFRIIHPNVADQLRGKTRYSALDVVAHRLGQDEAYFTVREILAEASTAADGVL